MGEVIERERRIKVMTAAIDTSCIARTNAASSGANPRVAVGRELLE